MLVLSRRANQSIVIGNDIVVTVLEVRGDQVRLGIRAPREVTVHREEVFAEIQRENREAAGIQVDDIAGMLPSAPPGAGKPVLPGGARPAGATPGRPPAPAARPAPAPDPGARPPGAGAPRRPGIAPAGRGGPERRSSPPIPPPPPPPGGGRGLSMRPPPPPPRTTGAGAQPSPGAPAPERRADPSGTDDPSSPVSDD